MNQILTLTIEALELLITFKNYISKAHAGQFKNILHYNGKRLCCLGFRVWICDIGMHILKCNHLYYFILFATVFIFLIIPMNTDHNLYDKVRLSRSRSLKGLVCVTTAGFYWSIGSQLKYREIYIPTRCCKMEKLCWGATEVRA